jgi:hypothetical protein
MKQANCDAAAQLRAVVGPDGEVDMGARYRACRETREEGSLGRLLWRWVDCPEILALEFPPALRTVRELLTVGVARFEVIEEHPQIAASDPPELPPQIMTLPAWATHHDHLLTS